MKLKIKNLLTSYSFIFLLIIFLSFILRLWPLYYDAISFHYDMARDAFWAREIWYDHQLKILGAPTSNLGLYHGVFYYYLIAPFYWLGSGDPIFPAVFLSLSSCFSVIPIMLVVKDITKSKLWTIVSGLFFVFSYEATQYSLWLSNPQPALFTCSMFFYSIWNFYKGKKWGFYMSFFWAGISTQFQFFLIYLFLIIVIYAFIFKNKIAFKDWVSGIIISFITLSSFFLSVIKFDLFSETFNSLESFFIPDKAVDGGLIFRLKEYVVSIIDLYSYNFYPKSKIFAIPIAIISIWIIRKYPAIYIFLFSGVLLFLLGGHNNNYVNVSLLAPAIVSVTLAVNLIWKYNKYLSLLILLAMLHSNLTLIYDFKSKGQSLFVIPKDMLLRNQYQLIDKTYQQSFGEPFSINTVTLPFWTPTTWDYLYLSYGYKKYGYLPSYHGHDPIGTLGGDTLKYNPKPEKYSFYIIEESSGMPSRYYQSEILDEDSRTNLKREYYFGSLRLQERSLKDEKNSL